MANSTAIITDLTSVITNKPSATTTANAINASGFSVSGGTGNMTGCTGNYGPAGGTFYGGILDYVGACNLAVLKTQELARLVTQIIVLTDQSSDGTNQALLAKILNDLQ